MNSWKVILATMVIFGTGVITGGLLVKNTAGSGMIRPPKMVVRTNQQPGTITPPQMARLEFLFRARNELNLTPEQQERIEKIIREGQEKSRKLWDGVAPEMRKELQSVHEKIRAELSPEQRHRFEQLLKNAARPGRPEEGQPPPQMRDRNRSQNNVTPPFNPDGQPRPPRRDFPPPPGNPPPENPQPAPAEPH